MMGAKVRRPPEVKKQALAMYADGMLATHIAAELGIPYTTVAGWCDPSTAEKQKARRARYAGVCVDCGGATDGSNGFGSAPDRCARCQAQHQHDHREWNQQAVIAAMRRFAEANGRPPASGDFTPAILGDRCSPERVSAALAAKRTGRYPSMSVVMREFGTWQNALAAAGFGKNPTGGAAHMSVPTSNSADRIAAMFERELARLNSRATALEEQAAALRVDAQRIAAARDLLSMTDPSNGNGSAAA